MIPARFKVHNYCSIVWTPPLPGGKIASGATVVRVRGEQIVDSASFVFTKDTAPHNQKDIQLLQDI